MTAPGNDMAGPRGCLNALMVVLTVTAAATTVVSGHPMGWAVTAILAAITAAYLLTPTNQQGDQP